MAYKKIETIPLSKIKKIELYMNTGKRTLSSIKKLTGCDYIMNGGIYNMSTFQSYCNVKSNGVIQYDPKYNEYGMAWNTNDIIMTLIPNNAAGYKNYLGCIPLIYHRVKQSAKTDSAMGGKRGRTAIGIKGSNLVLYCTKDGSSYAKNPVALRDELFALGCTDALMLDGGGSSQCNFNGTTITSSRVVANLILVYLNKVTVPDTPTTTKNPYKAATRTLYRGCAGSDVRWLQWYLKFKFLYNIAVDGSFGPATLNAVKSFQKSKGLMVDGFVGPATRAALIK